MHENEQLRHRRASWALGLTAVCLSMAFSHRADAGCVDIKAVAKKTAWQTPGEFFGSARLVKVASVDSDPVVTKAPIVGLWVFRYLSNGNLETLGIPDGAVLDGGNTIWYADGNENTVSGVRAPDTGDVCLGIWQRTGPYNYELNHIGLSWDPVKKVSAGPAFIKQKVTLSEDGQSYVGVVTISQLDPDGKTLSTPAPIKGYIYAHRITIDSTSQEALQ